MKAKSILVLIITIMALTLCSCNKCTNITEENVTVFIKECDYTPVYVQPMYIGKVWHYITTPANYSTIVTYDDVDYEISDAETYDKYKDKQGEKVKGILRIKTYENGKTKREIISLE